MSKIRLVPPVYFLLAVGAALLLHRLLPVIQLVSAPWHWLGLAGLAPVALLGGSAVRALGRRGTTLHPFGQPSALVTDGAFGFTRNPLYLSLAILLLGLAVFLGSLTAFAVVPVFVWAITTAFIRREEAALAAAFGAEFHAYCRDVRRWL